MSGEKLTTEEVLDHAEIAATFFRNLVTEGVPIQAAISITGQYISSVVITQKSSEGPDQPWEV